MGRLGAGGMSLSLLLILLFVFFAGLLAACYAVLFRQPLLVVTLYGAFTGALVIVPVVTLLV